MTAQLIQGKAIATKIREEVAAEIITLRQQGFKQPGLAVILIGNDSASEIYVHHKHQACESVGIKSFNHALPSTVSEEQLITLLEKLNDDAMVDGILLQLPLPEHMDSDKILEHIHPKKDVDGFHPYNLGRLEQRR